MTSRLGAGCHIQNILAWYLKIALTKFKFMLHVYWTVYSIYVERGVKFDSQCFWPSLFGDNTTFCCRVKALFAAKNAKMSDSPTEVVVLPEDWWSMSLQALWDAYYTSSMSVASLQGDKSGINMEEERLLRQVNRGPSPWKMPWANTGIILQGFFMERKHLNKDDNAHLPF